RSSEGFFWRSLPRRRPRSDSTFSRRYHPRNALQIGYYAYVFPVFGTEKIDNGITHRVANLERQPAARLQRLMGLLNQGVNHIEAVFPGEYSHSGLELEHRPLYFIGFAKPYVRWIADHKVEIAKIREAGPSAWTEVLGRDDRRVLIRNRPQNITLQELHSTFELQSRCIRSRSLQCGSREIGRTYFGVLQLV